jgi:hypothetical protein
MLAIAPKDNLVRTSSSRVTVVIEPSMAAQWQTSFSFQDLAGRGEHIAPGSTDQGTELGGKTGSNVLLTRRVGRTFAQGLNTYAGAAVF